MVGRISAALKSLGTNGQHLDAAVSQIGLIAPVQ
jgi:hypothetical protein